MLLTLRDLRNKLSVGTEFVGTFYGRGPYAKGEVVAKRRVVKQSSTSMESLILEGNDMGRHGHLDWKGMQATQSGDDIMITRLGDSTPFFKINILSKE